MRGLILIAGAALALGACGNDDQADNAVNADASMAAGSIASNDVTAIDAVTGDSSNMAADVNYVSEFNDLGGSSGPSADRSSAPRRATGNAADANAAAPEPAANATAPAPATSSNSI